MMRESTYKPLEFEGFKKQADLIKNPLVLEFLDLPEHPHYSEQELESEGEREGSE